MNLVAKQNDAPLGEDDASRRSDVTQVFVDVRSLIPQVNLSSDDMLSIKTVVGKKGSGKTHILKYIATESEMNREVIYCALTDNNIPTALGNQLSSLHDLPNVRTLWSKFWRIVINLSILSKFCSISPNHQQKDASRIFVNHKYSNMDNFVNVSEWKSIRSILIKYFSEIHFSKFTTIFVDSINNYQLPTTIMHGVLQKIKNSISLGEFIDDVDIDRLDVDIAALAKHFKPIHMIIDGIDDVSWKQPSVWLDFQVGLFDASFNFSNISRVSSQICLTVAIRNYVYLHALQTPHSDRFDGLLSLNWNPDSAKSFLENRLRQVKDGNFLDSEKLGDADPLASWLGFAQIHATRRNSAEDVIVYFLRHTRLSPRHIIKFFNTMCAEKNRLGHLNVQRKFGPDEFRTLISQRSLEVADTMLHTTAE